EPMMMLYLGNRGAHEPGLRERVGFGVVHATLHVPLRSVFKLLTVERIAGTIAVTDAGMRPLTGGRPTRVAVAALNRHAGESGLFGDEETRLITPAIEQAREAGVDVTGLIAADTLFARALDGEF